MEETKPFDLEETINRLMEEIRTLRSALAATDSGRTMLQQEEEFSRLLSVSKLIVSELDLEKVLNLVADSAREIVNAELVLVPMLNEGRDRYIYAAASGTDAEKALGTSLGAHVGMCGWVLRNKRSLLFGETSTHWLDEKSTWEEGQQSAVLVPLIGRKGIIGGLTALGKQGGGCFTQRDLDLLTMFANQVSIAIENAQLFREVTREIEDRKRAEDALYVSRNTLRLILNTMPQSVFWKDRDCVYLGCNDVFARTVGLDNPDKITGKTDFDLPWPRSEAEAYRANDQEVMATNLPKRHIVEPLQQADGTRIWIDTSKVPLVDRNGTVFGVLGVYGDITEIKNMQDALEEKTAEQKAILENALVGIALLKDRRFIWINSRMEQMFGYKRDEVSGLTTQILYPSDEDYEQFGKEAYPLLAGGETYSLERLMKRKDGSVFWCSLSGKAIAPALLEKGSIWILQDITAQKEAEEKIRQSEQFVRKILDTVDEGFIVIDRDYRILTANKAYCSQIGGCDKSVIGSHCYEISHKTNRPCFEEGEECAVRQVFETGESHTSLHRHTDAEGNIQFVETKAYPIKDASGKVTSAIETINNITEKYLLEEERLKTQKLESIGTLAGGIAHDFNNLLQSIFGYISMAKLRISNPRESLSVLSQAEKALDMSVNLTKQLLTFSKGGMPVKKPISLMPTIENAAKFALSGSRSSCQFFIEPGLWQVDADEGQLGQVIQNIVLNADQAMPGGGTIVITAKNVLKPDNEHPQLPKGKYVELSVKDSGIGIPDKYLQKIFDPYFTTKDKGSGLGLATSYSIIRNHGGLINVTSEPGMGTTFFIYMPATEEKKEIKAHPLVAPVVQKGKILVMDDDEMVLKLAELQIKTLGYEVDFAMHGKAVIEKYQEAMDSGRPYDVVILDLTIRGGMGGKETLEQLYAIQPGVKAIVSSGYSSDDIVAEYERYGFKARLDKPYKLEVLRETLNKVLSA